MSEPWLSRSLVRTSGIEITAIGTFSQKIHCQSIPCTTAPPISGPLATARPVIALNIPIAAPRFSGGNAELSSASPSGMIRAEPAPCTARAAISTPTFGATAQTADAIANKPSPTAYSRRRPKRSPSAAPVISSTAKLRL